MKASTLYRIPVALAAALAMAATVYPAFAQTKSDSTPATPPATTQAGTTPQSGMTGQSSANSSAQASSSGNQQMPQLSARDRDVMKLSNDGFASMRAVRAARLAIFMGDPKAAHDMVAAAESSLKAASKDATAFHADQKNNANQPPANPQANSGQSADKAGYVPIDGQITLVDSFIDSPAKKGHVDKANENIAKGKSKEAMDELKLAEVDASFTRVLMPLQATQKHVDAASKLIDQKKFYEANLALKAAEDGLVLDTVVLNETPKSGAANNKANSQANPPASQANPPANQNNAAESKPKS